MTTVRLREDQAERLAGHATATADYAVRRLFRGDFSEYLEWDDGNGLVIHRMPPQCAATGRRSTLPIVSLSASSPALKKFFSGVHPGASSEAMRLVLDAHFSVSDKRLDESIVAAKSVVAREWERLRAAVTDGQAVVCGDGE